MDALAIDEAHAGEPGRDFAVADNMLQTSQLIRKNRSQQIFRFHSLEGRGELRATAKTRNGERTSRVPTPANREHWRVEERLDKKIANSLGIEVSENFVERKRMLRSKRDNDRVVGGSGLQFEIE